MTGTQRQPVYADPSVATLREFADTDMIITQDAAEEASLTKLVFTATTSGDTDLAAPAAGKSIVLRRVTPILADPDGVSNPLISLFLGATEVARGYVLSGRFNQVGPVDGHLIVNLSKTASVSGTIFYEEI